MIVFAHSISTKLTFFNAILKGILKVGRTSSFFRFCFDFVQFIAKNRCIFSPENSDETKNSDGFSGDTNLKPISFSISRKAHCFLVSP